MINVVGNINVAPGAVLDAQSAPSTITVGHNVTAGSGSLLGLGCQPTNTIGMFAGVPCAVEPTGHTTITVNGNVTATDANTVLMRKMTVNGNVTLTGGGGDIPWSIKGNTIGGNLTISGVTADWLGVQFNKIGGNATLTNITATDPGDPGRTVAVVENTVGRNLNCIGTRPRRVRRFHPRRGQPRRRQRDRSVRIPGLTSFAPRPSATPGLKRVADGRCHERVPSGLRRPAEPHAASGLTADRLRLVGHLTATPDLSPGARRELGGDRETWGPSHIKRGRSVAHELELGTRGGQPWAVWGPRLAAPRSGGS